MANIKRIDYEEFRPFLESLNLVSVSSEWTDFVRARFGAKPCHFGVFENGRLNFIIPVFETPAKELIGVPKLYTEIVAYDASGKTPLADILTFFRKDRNFDSTKLSICPVLDSRFSDIAQKEGLQLGGLAHILELAATEEDEILAKVIGHKTRNQILASYKRGNFNVSVGQDINEFYKIYLASIKRLKSIPKELEFFTDLEKSFKGNLQIIFAYHGSAPAGANLVLIKNKYLHLMFNVSNVEFFKDYVNDFLYWETIKFGLARGIEIFDFGPSSVRDKSHHHFKEGFGAKPVPIYNFTHYNSFDYRLRDFVFRKARNLRLKLNKLF